MTVYVDPLMPCTPNAAWRWTHACHLLADTLDELHDFAGKLCLKRAWFQAKAHVPHYDLTDRKCRRAIQLGAVQLTTKQMAARLGTARAPQTDRDGAVSEDEVRHLAGSIIRTIRRFGYRIPEHGAVADAIERDLVTHLHPPVPEARKPTLAEPNGGRISQDETHRTAILPSLPNEAFAVAQDVRMSVSCPF